MQIVGEIPRLEASNVKEIHEKIALASPFTVCGLVQDWRFYHKWTRSALLSELGAVRVQFRLSPTNVHPVIDATGELEQLENQENSLAEYLELMSTTPNVFLDANLVSLVSRRGKTNSGLGPLLADVELPPFVKEAEIDTIGLWLSGKGVKTRLHYDRNGKNNFNAQLAGKKDFVLVPPSEIRKLYPLPMTSSIYNFTKVNNHVPDLEEFPLFAEVMGYHGTLFEGDLLFIPAFWYHSFTHVTEFNFNLNFWCDATDAKLCAAALRNEVATMLQTYLLKGRDDSSESWSDLARHLEECCLNWSPQRATSDEVRLKLDEMPEVQPRIEGIADLSRPQT